MNKTTINLDESFKHFFISVNPERGKQKLVMGIQGSQLTFDRDYKGGRPNLHQTRERTREHIPLLEIEPRLLTKLPVYFMYQLKWLIDSNFFNDKINISVLIRNDWILLRLDDNPIYENLLEKKRNGKRIQFSEDARFEDIKKLWITPYSLIESQESIFHVYGKQGTQFKFFGTIIKDYRNPFSREFFFINEKKMLKFIKMLFFVNSKMFEKFEEEGNVKIQAEFKENFTKFVRELS